MGFAEINGGDQKLGDFKQLIQSCKTGKAKWKLCSGLAWASCAGNLARSRASAPRCPLVGWLGPLTKLRPMGLGNARSIQDRSVVSRPTNSKS